MSVDAVNRVIATLIDLDIFGDWSMLGGSVAEVTVTANSVLQVRLTVRCD